MQTQEQLNCNSMLKHKVGYMLTLRKDSEWGLIVAVIKVEKCDSQVTEQGGSEIVYAFGITTKHNVQNIWASDS